MAIDHPAQVERLVLMDILPTAHVYANVTRRTATAYYHWFFFIQPYDLPERMISADPIWYLHRLLAGWASPIDGHHPDALAAYEEAFSDPEARHAMMEDYRAGAKIDLRLDEESAAAGRRIQAPALVLWGGRGLVGSDPEGPLAVWRRLTDRPGDMEGAPIEGAGHFMLEDRPDDTIAALTAFLSQPPR
jgi:haloacetate dehalogenase